MLWVQLNLPVNHSTVCLAVLVVTGDLVVSLVAD
jgi:hypothetical protein